MLNDFKFVTVIIRGVVHPPKIEFGLISTLNEISFHTMFDKCYMMVEKICKIDIMDGFVAKMVVMFLRWMALWPMLHSIYSDENIWYSCYFYNIQAESMTKTITTMTLS